MSQDQENKRTSSGLITLRGKLTVLLLTVTVMLLLLGGGLGAATVIATGQPGFCAKCHEMLPEYYTWQASTHSNFACSQCHQISLPDKVYQHYSGSYDSPIQLSQPISDQTCERCHARQRQATPSGDLTIPHDTHLENQVSCVTCHSGVVHGNIATRGKTLAQEIPRWTPELGGEYTASGFTRPPMQLCIDCHSKRGAPTRCSACHTAKEIPPGHRRADWGTTHGREARGNHGVCVSCHTYGVTMDEVNVTDKLTAYARGNAFCSGCHLRRPVTHGEDWMPRHQQAEAQKGRQNCLTCHEIRQPASEDGATATYCNQCHWFEPETLPRS